jgi:DNA-binding transcriptional LysR family regulator
MDQLEALRVFVRVVERRSFTLAAEDLSYPRSTATEAVQQVEKRLGVRLLQRTTRTVRPTLDGEAYYQRCLAILSDLEEAESVFTGAKPKGTLRIDVHGTLARYFMLPALPRFFAMYPDIRLHIEEGNRPLNLISEGVDCILRAGEPADTSMVGRRVALLPRGTYASPKYLKQHGIPRTPDDLAGHRRVGYISSARGEVEPLRFTSAGKAQAMTLPSLVEVVSPDSNVACAELGLGLIQVPHYRVEAAIKARKLMPVLEKFPPPALPVYVLYPQRRQLSPRVRVFIDWVAAEFAERAPLPQP